MWILSKKNMKWNVTYSICSISVPIHSNPDVDLESQATSFDHYIPPCRLSDSGNGANGFMLISDENEVDLLSHQYKVSTNLNIINVFQCVSQHTETSYSFI